MLNKEKFNIWEGIYNTWEDAPLIDGAFNSTKWIDDQTTIAQKELMEFLHNNQFISSSAQSYDYILPTVVAMSRKEASIFKVLDFGGGLATSYVPLISSLPNRDLIEFHVVESPEICKKGAKIYPENLNIFFHSKLPENTYYDVIHVARTFQYIEDWQVMLASFVKLKPRYIILAGVLAGNIESFISIQNYYGHKIRVHFLNINELISEAESLGFHLINKSLHISKRLGELGVLPMKNFPESHRIEYPCQLLFELKNTT
jgi:putative methyltransferase (TIGR04325 family)